MPELPDLEIFSSNLHRRLSEIYEQINEPTRALAQYDELLAHDSLNFEAWYNKGILLSRLRDTAGGGAAVGPGGGGKPGAEVRQLVGGKHVRDMQQHGSLATVRTGRWPTARPSAPRRAWPNRCCARG